MCVCVQFSSTPRVYSGWILSDQGAVFVMFVKDIQVLGLPSSTTRLSCTCTSDQHIPPMSVEHQAVSVDHHPLANKGDQLPVRSRAERILDTRTTMAPSSCHRNEITLKERSHEGLAKRSMRRLVLEAGTIEDCGSPSVFVARGSTAVR